MLKRDWGLVGKLPNPWNPQCQILMVQGIHTYGVLGALRAITDPSLRGPSEAAVRGASIRKRVLHRAKWKLKRFLELHIQDPLLLRVSSQLTGCRSSMTIVIRAYVCTKDRPGHLSDLLTDLTHFLSTRDHIYVIDDSLYHKTSATDGDTRRIHSLKQRMLAHMKQTCCFWTKRPAPKHGARMFDTAHATSEVQSGTCLRLEPLRISWEHVVPIQKRLVKPNAR